MSQCGQRIGFLTFAMCSEIATAACTRCGKPLCAMHIHTSSSGTLCPDCAVTGWDEDDVYRHGYYSSYYRSHTDAYNSRDYDSFEAGGGEMGGGGASGDWDSADAAGDSGGDNDLSDVGGMAAGAAAFQDS
jgi:uncharacterized membrane protein YgcG